MNLSSDIKVSCKCNHCGWVNVKSHQCTIIDNKKSTHNISIETDTLKANVETDTLKAHVETDTLKADVETDTLKAHVETDTLKADASMNILKYHKSIFIKMIATFRKNITISDINQEIIKYKNEDIKITKSLALNNF